MTKTGTKSARFFAILWRVNAVLFLLVLLGAAAALVSSYGNWSRWRSSGEGTVAAGMVQPSLPLRLQRSQRIFGSEVWMAKANEPSVAAKSVTRNILFLTDSGEYARWLFPDARSVILDVIELSEELHDQRYLPPRFLGFEYVPLDTTGDGILSSADRVNLGFAAVDGSGFTVALQGISKVLSYEIDGSGEIAITYQKDGVVRHTLLNAPDFKPASDQPSALCPPACKPQLPEP